MVRGLLGIVAFAAPLLVFGAMQGCSDEPPHQDICNWLADANNCYARFSDDVGTQCGYPHVAGSDPLASTTGAFLMREELAQCIKNDEVGGGLINFDPPLDPTAFPVTALGVTIIDRKGAECGKISVGGPQSYTVTIQPVDKDDAGASTTPDGGPLPDDITGGSVLFSQPAGRERLDVSCAGGLESYNFNLLAPVSKCAQYASFLPTAVIESHPGLPEGAAGAGAPAVPGFVRLRIHYPPVDPKAEGAQPRVVEYFNCSIPPPPPPCQDGVRNGTETDIDCGGDCPGKCADGQGCNVNEDCLSNNCGFNMGLQQCVP